MSKKFQIKGLIIYDLRVEEDDKLITLLTAERGKILVNCKGVCKLTSRHFSLIQPYTYGDFVLSESPGGFLYLVEGTIIESFRRVPRSLSVMALCAYIAQVANCVTTEENDESDMLRNTLNTLWGACYEDIKTHLIKATFEMRTAVICGFMPEVSSCATCGKLHDEGYFFDIMNGIIKGKNCVLQCDFDINAAMNEELGTANIIVPISCECAQILCEIISSSPKRALAFARVQMTDELILDIKNICEKYLINQIERGFDTLDFYNSIFDKSKRK